MHGPDEFPASRVKADAHRQNRDGHWFYEVHASGFARAPQMQAWGVLTDYDRLAEFVPDLVSSHVLSRSGSVAIVEQTSQVGILLLAQRVRIQVRIEEDPYSVISVSLVTGDMRHYAAHWCLTPRTHDGHEGTVVTFNGELEPDFVLPPLFGEIFVQGNVERMVAAVVAEIERRSTH